MNTVNLINRYQKINLFKNEFLIKILFNKLQTEAFNLSKNENLLDQEFGKLAASKNGFKNKFYLDSEFAIDDKANLERMEMVTNKKSKNYYYFNILNAIVHEKKHGVKKAFDLYNEMKLDRKLVRQGIVALLIQGCSYVGDVDKAFEMFDIYLNFKTIQPLYKINYVISSMFKCCSRATDVKIGLEKANELYIYLIENNINLNKTNYDYAIKAFGVLGDLNKAFQLLDKMVESRIKPDKYTFSMLLLSCKSQKNNGSDIAVNIIQVMKVLKIKPDNHIYSILLKTIENCELGTEKNLLEQIYQFKISSNINSNFLRSILDYNRKNQIKFFLANEYPKLSMEELENKSLMNVKKLNNEILNFEIFNQKIHKFNSEVHNKLDFKSLTDPKERFIFLGGLDKFLDEIIKNGEKTNSKVLTSLLALIPDNELDESKIINFALENSIQLDTSFFNLLIKRARLREDLALSEKYLEKLTSLNLFPDIQTYSNLTIGCNSLYQIKNFIQEMEKFNIVPNTVIYDQLISNAGHHLKFKALNYLILKMKKNSIQPDKKLIEKLLFAHELGYSILKQNNGEYLKNDFLIFKNNMQEWLKTLYLSQDILNEDYIQQFRAKDLPKNEDLHKYNIQMKKLLDYKKEHLSNLD